MYSYMDIIFKSEDDAPDFGSIKMYFVGGKELGYIEEGNKRLRKYVLLSTDLTKLNLITNALNGSSAFVIDTGETYKLSDNGWLKWSEASLRFELKLVNNLPQTGEFGYIYLVPNSHGTNDEYIWTSNNTFEKIGDTAINYSVMTGASENSAGTSGLTPIPPAGSENYFLKADATWSNQHNPIDISYQSLDLNTFFIPTETNLRQLYRVQGDDSAANILHKPTKNGEAFFLTIETIQFSFDEQVNRYIYTTIQTIYGNNGGTYRRRLYHFKDNTDYITEWQIIHPLPKRIGTSNNAIAIFTNTSNNTIVPITDLNLLRDRYNAGYYICNVTDNIANLPITPDANSSTELNFGLQVIITGDTKDSRTDGGCVQILHYHGNITNNTGMKTYRRRYAVDQGWSNWVEDKYTDTTYSEATTSTAGLMSAEDKTKLNNAIIDTDLVVCTASEYEQIQNKTARFYFIVEDNSPQTPDSNGNGGNGGLDKDEPPFDG